MSKFYYHDTVADRLIRMISILCIGFAIGHLFGYAKGLNTRQAQLDFSAEQCIKAE